MVVAALLAACSPGAPMGAGSASQAGAAAPAGVPVKVVTPLKPGAVRAANQVTKPFRATATRWPSAASGSVVLQAAAAAGQEAGPATRVAGTPLWVQSVPGGGKGASQDAAHASVVTAAVLPHSRAAALGVSGVVLQLGGSAPAAASPGRA